MITLLASAPPVVMPMWVFLLLVMLLVGLNGFLMWCNHEQARVIRRQKRRLELYVTRDPAVWTSEAGARVAHIVRKTLDGGGQ